MELHAPIVRCFDAALIGAEVERWRRREKWRSGTREEVLEASGRFDRRGRRASGASPSRKRHELFNPDSIAGLVVWLEPNVVTLSGSTISEFDDQKGDDQSLVQGAGTAQPAYLASDADFNGRPSVGFDGSNDRIADPSPASDWKFASDGTGVTIVGLVYYTGTAVTQTFLDNERGTGTNVGHAVLINGAGGSELFTWGIGAGGVNAIAVTTAAGTLPRNTLCSFVLRYKEGGIPGRGAGVEYSIRTQGVERNTGVSANPPSAANPTDPLTMGGRSPDTATNPYTGKTGLVLYYNVALTDADVVLLSNNYTVPRWGRSL